MSIRAVSDSPVFIRNLESLIGAVTDILHEIDRDGLSQGDRRSFDQAYRILNLAEDACGLFVDEVESGPDYQLAPSPLKAMFDLWIELRDEANKASEAGAPQDLLDERFAKANAAERKILDQPVTSLKDLAAKLVTVTEHGSYMDLSTVVGGVELVKEAAALVGRSDHLDLGGAS